MTALERAAFRTARTVARRRGPRPALHPSGVLLSGGVAVSGRGPSWGVPWLDAPGSYEVTARWSRAAGLPRPLPDGTGLALRVRDAGGPGRSLDLLLTGSGRGRWTRHVPLPRTSATAGPYSTLLSYEVGGRRGVVAAFPVPGAPPVPADPGAVADVLTRRTVEFVLCFGAGTAWRPLARLTLDGTAPDDRPGGQAYDPYLNALPGFGPGERLRALRTAAYAGSRAGRGARTPA